jgi:hypothetical protein
MFETPEKVIEYLKDWCLEKQIHDFDRYMKVYKHGVKALRATSYSEDVKISILLACLLYEVDIKQEFVNVREILSNCFCMQHEDLVVEMISISKNDNSSEKSPWKYIPRDCDRLETIGEEGIARCEQYALRIGNPLHTETTPLPTTMAELEEVINYCPVEVDGNSKSMLDHFYDKLLHLGYVASENKYIVAENHIRMTFIKNWLLNVNKVIKLIKNLKVK